VSDRILLVGGTGFLGSFVARRLAARGATALVRISSDVSALPGGMQLLRGDLDAALPLDGFSTLVYCASMGFGHVPPLVSHLQTAGITRAVFTSTTAIFTSLPSTSRRVRMEAESAVQSSTLDWTILRPTMIYGTARDRNISRLLHFLKRWPVFPLAGNGLWQPIYVEDAADAVVCALDSPRTSRRVYNVAGAQPLALADLVRIAARAVGRNVHLFRVPLRAAVLGAKLTRIVTPEQVLRLVEDKAFSYAEATRDFGFAPRSFAEGVAREAEALGLAPGRPAVVN
jgi:nucleoside-diphosphate-sugar epimerase